VLNRAESIRNYFGDDHVQDKDTFSKLFFAIVAPSMTGKTQAAFTFKRIRCLYFLLSKTSKGVTQEIYKNFTDLSEKLQKFVYDDFKKLKKLYDLDNDKNDLYAQISSYRLWTKHLHTKFKTLGFIYALIEHGNANFDPNGTQSWMKFFATSSKSFIIESKSLYEFRKLDARGYALFFDEFEASDENAFVRNLFRAALAPVLVASTNSNVANLAGILYSSHSRVGDSCGWSLAAVILNDVNQNILRRIYPNLHAKVREITDLAPNDIEKGLIKLFFKNFFKIQLKHLRPGCAHIIAAKILEMPNLIGFTLDTLLQTIVGEMAAKLTHKKSIMNVELEGVLGSLALFMDTACISSNTWRKDFAAKISHMKSYLQYHFYYLINPVDVNNWCFLTYRPIPGDVHLRVKSLDGRFVKWDMENTYFRAEEITPLLACQSVINSSSISNLLRQGLAISDSSVNPSQNVPLNADELEVLSSICIIEASQHGVGCLNSSFSGQDGISFLTNLIGNLIEAQDYRRNNKVDMIVPLWGII
jgi:hypothetical protein